MDYKEQNYYDFKILLQQTAGKSKEGEVDTINLLGENLIIRGKITFEDKQELEFSTDVDLLNLKFEIEDEDDPDILRLNKKAKKFNAHQFLF